MYGPAQSFTRIFVIGIIAMLIAMLLPGLSHVRQHSLAVRCAANLQQISIAFKNYLIDARQKKFWRSANPSLEGMDWYVYGGQETGNANIGQAGLFNRFQPRPLNPYVGGKVETFHCPSDGIVAKWTQLGVSHFDWVGNSYLFNAVGQPNLAISPERGLAGVQFTKGRDASHTILLSETAAIYSAVWHVGGKTKLALADGQVVCVALNASVKAGEMGW